ncbi:MAG TPA: hypothetical protein ENI23_00730 [bacterium]|nr:hypothetical protein [bacterium]
MPSESEPKSKFPIVPVLIIGFVILVVLGGLLLIPNPVRDAIENLGGTEEETSEEQDIDNVDDPDSETVSESETSSNGESSDGSIEEEESAGDSTNDAFAKARNAQRELGITVISNGILVYMSDGNSLSSLGTIPNCSTSKASIGTASGNINLAAKLVEAYLPDIPEDSQVGTAADTGYTICQTTDGKIRIDAPNAELGKEISVQR